MKITHGIYAIGFALIFLTACDKTESLSVSQTESSNLIADEQTVENASSDVDAMIDEALTMKSLTTLKSTEADSNIYLGNCASVLLDTTTLIKKLTIDFGNNCLGKDGKIRSGKIIVATTSFSRLGVERIVGFQNYVVNGDTVYGTIRKTISVLLSVTKRKAHVVENLEIHRTNSGGTVKRTTDIYRVYDYDHSIVVRDDKIYTWGNATFTNSKSAVITKSVTELKPLIFRLSCRQIVSGIQVVTRGDKVLTTDFGEGICDDIATVSDGNNSWTIKL